MGNTITNEHGDDWVYVDGYGKLNHAELRALVNAGRVKETITDNSTGNVISESISPQNFFQDYSQERASDDLRQLASRVVMKTDPWEELKDPNNRFNQMIGSNKLQLEPQNSTTPTSLRDYAELMTRRDFEEKSRQSEEDRRKEELRNQFESMREPIIDFDQQRRKQMFEPLEGYDDKGFKLNNKQENPVGKIYNYLKNTEGREAAEKYYKTITPELNRMNRELQDQRIYEQSHDNPLAGAAVSLATLPLNPIEFAAENLSKLTTGKIDENDPLFSGTRTSRAALSGATKRVGEILAPSAKEMNYVNLVNSGWTPEKARNYVNSLEEKYPDFYKHGGEFAFGTAYSIAEFIFSMLLGNAVSGNHLGTGAYELSGMSAEEAAKAAEKFAKNLSLLPMASGAASTTVLESKDNGMSDEQALVLGAIAGAAEWITEKYSIDAWLDPEKSLLSGHTFKYITKNMVAEGEEEFTSDIINIIADTIVAGDKSDFSKRMAELKNEGKSDAEAIGIWVFEKLASAGESALGGIISGLVMGVAGGARNYIHSNSLVKNLNLNEHDTLNNLINKGLSYKGTLPEELASKLQSAKNEGRPISNTEIAGLYNAVAEEKANHVETDDIANRIFNASANRSEVARYLDESPLNLDMPTFTVFDSMYTEGQPVPEYVKAMHDYYMAGLKGEDMESVDNDTLTTPQKQAAYEHGVEERNTAESEETEDIVEEESPTETTESTEIIPTTQTQTEADEAEQLSDIQDLVYQVFEEDGVVDVPEHIIDYISQEALNMPPQDVMTFIENMKTMYKNGYNGGDENEIERFDQYGLLPEKYAREAYEQGLADRLTHEPSLIAEPTASDKEDIIGMEDFVEKPSNQPVETVKEQDVQKPAEQKEKPSKGQIEAKSEATDVKDNATLIQDAIMNYNSNRSQKETFSDDLIKIINEGSKDITSDTADDYVNAMKQVYDAGLEGEEAGATIDLYSDDADEEALRKAFELGVADGNKEKTESKSTEKAEVKSEPKPETKTEKPESNDRLSVREAAENFRYIVKNRSGLELGDDFFDNIANGESDYDTILEQVQAWEDNGDIDESDFPNGFRELERLAEQLDEYMEDGTPIKYSKKSAPSNTKATDDKGRPIAKQMQEYMKNSYCRTGFTKDGKLKEMNHGTKTGTFTQFKIADDGISFFFSDSPVTSSTYSHSLEDITPDKSMTFEELDKFIRRITNDRYYLEETLGGKIRVRTDDDANLNSELEDNINHYLEILRSNDPKNASMYDLDFLQTWLFDEDANRYLSAEGLANDIINGTDPLIGDLDLSDDDADLLLTYGEAIDYYNQTGEIASIGKDYLPIGDGEEFRNTKEFQKYLYSLLQDSENGRLNAGIYKVYLNCENPLVIEGNGAEWYEISAPMISNKLLTTRQICEYAHDNGYDSVIFKDIWDGGGYGNTSETSNVVVVFKPEQIKSVYNQTPTTNPDIRYSKKSKPDKIQHFNDVYGDKTEWTTKRDGDKNKKPMSLTDIVNKIKHDFGVNITTGHMRAPDGVVAQFNQRDKGIRERIKNSLPAISHELGHWLDDKYGLTKGKLAKEVKQDLLKALGKGKENYTAKEYIAEGQAEFIKSYLTNRNETMARYPAATMNTLTKLTPKELVTLDNLADEINAYYSINTGLESSVVAKEHKYEDPRSVKKQLIDTTLAAYIAGVDSNYAINIIDNDAYKLATNAAYSGARVANIIKNELRDREGRFVYKGLAQILEPIDITDEDMYHLFNDYLVYQHGIERVQNGKRVFSNEFKNTVEYMQDRIAEIEAEHPEFKQVAEDLWEFENKLLWEWAVVPGLISKDTYNAWKTKYKKHVPLNRVMNQNFFARHGFGGRKREVGVYKNGARKGYANQTSTLKSTSRQGSGRDIIYPVDNIMDEISHLVTATTRNDVMLSLRNAALNSDSEIFADIMERDYTPIAGVTVDAQAVKDRISDKFKEANAEGVINGTVLETLDQLVDEVNSVITQFQKGKNTKPDVISVLVDGEQEFWIINDPLLLASVTNMNKPQLDGLLKAYAVTTRFITSNLTGNNPIWSIFSNAPRDLGTFLTYLKQKDFGSAFKAMGRAYLNEMNDWFGKGDVNPLHAEYLALGGGHDSLYSADTDMAKKARREITSNKFKQRLSMINPINFVSFVTDMIENGPREATYIMCRNQGMSPQEAFYESRDITVNFAKAGTMSRQINQVVPFFNASVQGIDKMGRYFSAEDIKGENRGKVAAQRTAMLIAASAILGMLSHAMNHKDDKTKEKYQLMSTYMKNSYFNIPIDFIADGKFFSIPKPREIAVLESFFERTFEYTAGDNKKAYNEFYDYVADNCLPGVASQWAKFVGDVPKEGFDKAFSDAIAGSLGDLGFLGVLVDVTANRDFLGRPIVSQAMQRLEPKDQYNGSTSKVALALGKALGYSPQKVDYIGKNLLGYIWKIQTALLPVDDSRRDLSLGIANSYVHDPLYSNDLINELYDVKEKSELAYNSDKENGDKAVLKTLDDRMASFWTNFNSLNKVNGSSKARENAIVMVRDYLNARGKGATSAEKMIIEIAKETKNTELLPATMQKYVKNSKKQQFDLSDSAYYEYQSQYNGKFYTEVEKNYRSSMTTEEKEVLIKSAKDAAKSYADNLMLKKYGEGSVEEKTTKTYEEVKKSVADAEKREKKANTDITKNPIRQQYTSTRSWSALPKSFQDDIDSRLMNITIGDTGTETKELRAKLNAAKTYGYSDSQWFKYLVERKAIRLSHGKSDSAYSTAEKREAAQRAGMNYSHVVAISKAK